MFGLDKSGGSATTTRRRSLFDDKEIQSASTLLPDSLRLTGGHVSCANGMLVDGKFTDVHFTTSDGSFICISTLAELEGCIIESPHILIEGRMNDCKLLVRGTEETAGRLEFGSGCQVSGEAYLGDYVDQVRGAKVITRLQMLSLDDVESAGHMAATHV